MTRTEASSRSIFSRPKRRLIAGLISLGLSGMVVATAHADALWSADKTFGRDGTTKTSLSADDLALDRQGRVILTGSVGPRYYSTFVARFDRTGNPDLSFADDGEAYFGGGNTNTFGQAVDIDAEGRILIAGHGTDAGGFRIGPELNRLNPDGSRDRSFKRKAAYPFFSGVGYTDVKSLQNGKILVVGGGEGQGTHQRPTILVRQFKADGKPDRRFGNRSRVVIKGPRYSQTVGTTGATNLHILPSGKFLVSGIYADKPWVGRFHANGRVDRNFGQNGSATMRIRQNRGCGVNGSCAPYGLAVVKHGSVRLLANKESKDGLRATGFVVGFTRDGSVDRRFGRDGRVKVLPNRFTGGGGKLIRLPGDALLVTDAYGHHGHVARVSANGRAVESFDHLGGRSSWVSAGKATGSELFLATWGDSGLLRKYRKP